MTVKEVAALTKCAPLTIRRWLKANKLRHLKIEGRILIDAESVAELFDKSER